MGLLPEGLLEILVCPNCRGELEERPESSTLRCLSCGLIYPVEDGIPIMLVERATREEPT